MLGHTNSGMFKGVADTETFRVLNERHPFFKYTDFTLGSLVYDGQPYFEVELRYNVYQESLFTRNTEAIGTPPMRFDKHKVTQFTIDGHAFRNMGTGDTGDNRLGFLEVLLENDSLALYKRYTKKIFKRTDEKLVYYEFKDGHSYYVQYAKTYFSLKKASELNAIFPEHKKSLKTIRDRHEDLRKTNPDSYMKSILLDLYGLMTNNNASGTL